MRQHPFLKTYQHGALRCRRPAPFDPILKGGPLAPGGLKNGAYKPLIVTATVLTGIGVNQIEAIDDHYSLAVSYLLILSAAIQSARDDCG